MIREIRDSDVPALRRLLGPLFVELPVGSEAAVRHWLVSPPKRARLLNFVAEEDDELVGFAYGGLQWQASAEGAADARVGVREDRRRRGIGGRLAAAVDEHLAEIGARHVESFALDGSEGHSFAERRGYRVARRERYSWIDPRTIDPGELRALEAEKAAEGFRAAPLAELQERPRDLFALDAATTADVPELFPQDDMRYEEWLEGTFGGPDLDWEGSRAAFAGDRAVAFTLLNVDREARRAENDMTGTVAEYRGRARAAREAVVARVGGRERNRGRVDGQ